MLDFITVPFGYVLRFCYEIVGSYGIAIIMFTIISKLVILPFQMMSKKSMVDMQRVQPKLKELEAKYKNDKERYALEVQKLYKKEGVSMFGGCLPMLIMLPIMFGLYYVVREPLISIFQLSGDEIITLANVIVQNIDNIPKNTFPEVIEKANYMVQIGATRYLGEIRDLYNAGALTNLTPDQLEVMKALFNAETGKLADVSFQFLNLIDLSQIPNWKAVINSSNMGELYLWAIPVLSGLTAWLSGWLMRKNQGAPMNEQAKATNGMMNIMMPAMSVWIAFAVPAGLGLYWIISNVISAVQEPLLTIYFKKRAEKKAREEK